MLGHNAFFIYSFVPLQVKLLVKKRETGLRSYTFTDPVQELRSGETFMGIVFAVVDILSIKT